jgi:hypothetical protein
LTSLEFDEAFDAVVAELEAPKVAMFKASVPTLIIWLEIIDPQANLSFAAPMPQSVHPFGTFDQQTGPTP